jgi:hypothetical protein
MRFVVKATGRARFPSWLSKPGDRGFRSLVPHKLADEFPTITDGRVAIAKMPRVFTDAGLVFSVERKDDLLIPSEDQRL